MKKKPNKTFTDILTQLVTESDDTTHDIFRYLALLSVLTAIGLTIYIVIHKGEPFDIQAYGIGLGAVLAAAGVALKLKEETKPTEDEDEDKPKT